MRKLASDLVSGLLAVAGWHARLARLEVREDAGAVGRNLGGVLAGLLFGHSGLLLVGVAMAVLAGRILGDPVFGFLALGGVFLLAGMATVWFFQRRLRQRRYLPSTRHELQESTRWLREEIIPGLDRNRNG